MSVWGEVKKAWDKTTEAVSGAWDSVSGALEDIADWGQDVWKGAGDVVQWVGKNPWSMALPLLAVPGVGPTLLLAGAGLGYLGQTFYQSLKSGPGGGLPEILPQMPLSWPGIKLTKEEKRFYDELRKLARLQRTIGAEEISYVKTQVWPAEERLIAEAKKPSLLESALGKANIISQMQRSPYSEATALLFSRGQTGSAADALRFAALQAQSRAGTQAATESSLRIGHAESEFERRKMLAAMGQKIPGAASLRTAIMFHRHL